MKCIFSFAKPQKQPPINPTGNASQAWLSPLRYSVGERPVWVFFHLVAPPCFASYFQRGTADRRTLRGHVFDSLPHLLYFADGKLCLVEQDKVLVEVAVGIGMGMQHGTIVEDGPEILCLLALKANLCIDKCYHLTSIVLLPQEGLGGFLCCCWQGVLVGVVRDGLVAVEGEEVFVEQELHFAHGALYGGGLELAFPDDDDLPSVVAEQGVVALVAFLVAAYLADPELAVGLRNLATGGVFYYEF